ncbi:alpha/beta fold hydrolase [Spirosoma utsteinense]|uniref:Pimeloyl-ACP methyl ester carboxylesterase n=1 Tax=Spirosoma utsteinense TaxID=2585773 RepID=A0ABR6W9X5_9BACT|nr:alpha/beta fold hydrolase [Spirosoma utsteinense]MBC3786055.1 pimeloyl-ACP methyl ester carboxylesterase [Spirosoma utsteinense]MBC3793358.1 pimeloyl-ACP methyl ester carboxylesterase [Spirosoma utsteinense]
MKLFFRQTGDTGPAIVIVHGLFGSSDNWLTISKTVAALGYRVFSIDQRNHGQSPRSNDQDYTSMAADLHEFLVDQQLENPVLVGHSMGGKTVMQYAMDYPDGFDKLVVVDIAPKFYPIHHAEIIRGLNAIDLLGITSRNEADAVLSRYEPIVPVRQFLLKNLYRNAQGQFNWRLNLPVIERELHGIGDELTNPKIVHKPTLFIRGSESPYIVDEDIPTIKRIFPAARIETIQDAGHWVQAEKPVEFVETLMKFIA